MGFPNEQKGGSSSSRSGVEGEPRRRTGNTFLQDNNGPLIDLKEHFPDGVPTSTSFPNTNGGPSSSTTGIINAMIPGLETPNSNNITSNGPSSSGDGGGPGPGFIPPGATIQTSFNFNFESRPTIQSSPYSSPHEGRNTTILGPMEKNTLGTGRALQICEIDCESIFNFIFDIK